MRSASKSRTSRAVRLLWLLESLTIVAAGHIAVRIRFLNDPDGYRIFQDHGMWRLWLVAAVLVLAMACFGLYQAYLRYGRLEFLMRLTLAFAFGGIALLVLYYVAPWTYVGRSVLIMTMAFGFLDVVLLRVLAKRVVGAELFKSRVLVFGAGENAAQINSSLRRATDRQSFVVTGFVAVPGQASQVPGALAVEGPLGLLALAEQLEVDEIVVAPDERRGCLPMESMLACVQKGIQISDLSTFFEREAGMVKPNVVDPSWLVFSGGFDHSPIRQLSKRLFDMVAASALLLVAWPFMLLTALCIWLETGTPIFYRQTRVGENGRTFELVKFRSMRVDAEADGVARWASSTDDRSTRVGRFIRKTRLDELPQLYNVLRGEMSFVGPRPERPQFVEMLEREIRYYHVRHSVKPGLTGWAQLRYPYGASVVDAERKLTFDLFYVKNQGLLFDMMILLQTVEVVLFRRGAR